MNAAPLQATTWVAPTQKVGPPPEGAAQPPLCRWPSSSSTLSALARSRAASCERRCTPTTPTSQVACGVIGSGHGVSPASRARPCWQPIEGPPSCGTNWRAGGASTGNQFLFAALPGGGRCISSGLESGLATGRRLFSKPTARRVLPLFEAKPKGLIRPWPAGAMPTARIPPRCSRPGGSGPCCNSSARSEVLLRWQRFWTRFWQLPWPLVAHRPSSSPEARAVRLKHDKLHRLYGLQINASPDWAVFHPNAGSPPVRAAAAIGGPWQERLQPADREPAQANAGWLNGHAPCRACFTATSWGGMLRCWPQGAEWLARKLRPARCLDPLCIAGSEVICEWRALFGGVSSRALFNARSRRPPRRLPLPTRTLLQPVITFQTTPTFFGGGYCNRRKARVWEAETN